MKACEKCDRMGPFNCPEHQRWNSAVSRIRDVVVDDREPARVNERTLAIVAFMANGEPAVRAAVELLLQHLEGEVWG